MHKAILHLRKLHECDLYHLLRLCYSFEEHIPIIAQTFAVVSIIKLFIFTAVPAGQLGKSDFIMLSLD